VTDKTSLPSYYRRNAIAFAGDIGFFQIAMSFISATTVLPTLIQLLSGSELMVGLASGITSGAWLLPQLFIAGYSARLIKKLPMVRRAAIITRPLLLLIALGIWLLGDVNPGLTVAIVLIGLFLFFVFDAVVSLPWFDLMAKGLPARRRGRVQGTAQVIGGVAGIGIGVFVRYTLGENSPWSFPDNYALLYALAFVAMAISTSFLAYIYEPEEAPNSAQSKVRAETPSTLKLIASLPGLIREDRPFLVMIIVRMLFSFMSVATAFYVLYATGELGFGIEDVGLFISAQVAGQLAAGFVVSVVQDKWGPKAHIRVIAVTAMLPPLLALFACAVAPRVGSEAIMLPIFMAIYFCMGLYMSSSGWPFFNWIMEHTDEVRRPLYIGASNTLGALAMLAPVLGGWLVNSFSYQAAFIVAAVFGATSLIATRWLKSTR